nr:hypothetical protein CFP56_33612 [Quercus suber]
MSSMFTQLETSFSIPCRWPAYLSIAHDALAMTPVWSGHNIEFSVASDLLCCEQLIYRLNHPGRQMVRAALLCMKHAVAYGMRRFLHQSGRYCTMVFRSLYLRMNRAMNVPS